MKKYLKFYYGLAIVAITLMMTSALIFAADMDNKGNYSMKGGYSILGSKFLGLDIENPQGDNIGEVKDIMLDSNGQVRYVAVSFGGFMGMGNTMYSVPMDAFTFQRDNDSFFADTKLLLNVTKEQLKDDKGFDADNWPNYNDEGYRNDLDKRYNIDRSNINDTRKMHRNYKGTMAGGYSILGSKFLGLNIENPQGDNIGEVKDIVLDSSGQVRYVVVSYGGFMGMGNKMYTVPMDAFTFQRDNDSFFADTKLLLNVTKEQLKDDKGFDADNWPNYDDEGYRNNLDKRYNIDRSNINDTRKMHENYKGTMRGGYSILGSKLIGLNIENPQGDNIGKVKDIVLDSSGQVRYVAVSYGGFMGMGNKMYTVPMDAFTFQRDTDSFFADTKLLLNVTKEQLKDDKGFDTGNWPNLDDDAYRKDLDKRYNINRDRSKMIN